jgi:hypothetical protein
MAMRAMTRVMVAAAVAVLVSTAGTGSAGAGGVPGLTTDRPFLRPGEPAVLRQEHIFKPSRDWLGPYRVWLRWAAYQPANAASLPAPPGPLQIGTAVIERWRDDYVRASVSFVVPGLPAGLYETIVTCDRCDAGGEAALGNPDRVFVGQEAPAWSRPPPAAPPAGPPAAGVTVPAPVTTVAPAPAAAEPADRRPPWWMPAVLAAGLAAWATVAIRRSRRPEGAVTAGA